MRVAVFLVLTCGFISFAKAEIRNNATNSYRGSLPSRSSWGPEEFPLVAVSDTTSFPARTIGRLGTGCTGTLIGRRHVLTAAHCVYNMDGDYWYDELQFSAGQKGESFPFGTTEWQSALVPDGWSREHNEDYDFALVILVDPIGDKLGWLGFGSDESLPQYLISITGYAGEKTAGTPWRSTCRISEVLPEWLNYPCETQGGMSGSGVVAHFPADDTHMIYGIHALGGSDYNSAVRITSAVFSLLAKWKSENP